MGRHQRKMADASVQVDLALLGPLKAEQAPPVRSASPTPPPQAPPEKHSFVFMISQPFIGGMHQPIAGDSDEGEGEGEGEDEEPEVTVTAAPPPPRARQTRKRQFADLMRDFTRTEREYFQNQSDVVQEYLAETERKVKRHNEDDVNVPLRFKILKNDMDLSTKKIVLAKIDQLHNSHSTSEHSKLKHYLSLVERLPIGKYRPLPVSSTDSYDKIASFIRKARETLNETVYGHDEAKDKIMCLIAQHAANPTARGICIGLQGPPGVAKTVLAKEGVAKALGLPFAMIPLGGESDAATLIGHSFTYESSKPGQIAEQLMKAGVMNPVILFDEVDKVAPTHRGAEVSGILTHLSDPSQNSTFSDRYFSEIKFDLSRTVQIYTYNDESLVSPILLDRMHKIYVKGYSPSEKIKIAEGYLIPSILADYKMTPTDIVFDEETLLCIIERVQDEEGVRNLKRGIETIVGWLNMERYLSNQKFPVTVTEAHVKKYIKTGSANSGPPMGIYV